jgi:starch synthase (maltosyl-transferring)
VVNIDEVEAMRGGQNQPHQGPRIYNLFPTLLGPIEHWHEHLPAIADMGFNWIFVNPFHLPGASGSLYAIKDYDQVNPVLAGQGDHSPDDQLAAFTAAAAEQGLRVMVDLVINHTARDSVLVTEHPDWYVRGKQGEVRSPSATDLDDPSKVTVWKDLAELDYTERPARAEMLDYWHRLLRHYAGLGFRGCRCDAAYKLPGEVWQQLTATARSTDAGTRFFAETLGAPIDAIMQLRPAGFDYFFNSAKWWNFRDGWLLEQYEQFRHLAPSIAFPESHDTKRLAAESGGGERESRFRYLFAAVFSSGVMMPIGYELGFRRPLHVVKTRPEQWEKTRFDLRAFIGRVNAMKAATPVLNEEGPQQRFTEPKARLVGLLRRSDQHAQRSAVLINPDTDRGGRYSRAALTDVLQCDPGALREVTPRHDNEEQPPASTAMIDVPPRSIRVFVAD